jgi:hypothetical protein
MGLPLQKQTTQGKENKLKWIPIGKRVQYLGIMVGHHLSTQANFDKLMKPIWGNQ